jgi:hypothetical protein
MNPPDLETNSDDRRVTRAELHAKVWSEPMVKIAKEFGISDRGLAKTCARLEVPVPPRGYWAKLQAGKPVSKFPLPAAKPLYDNGDCDPSNPSTRDRTRTSSTRARTPGENRHCARVVRTGQGPKEPVQSAFNHSRVDG